MVEISGATNSQYTLTSEDVGMYIFFKVTPAATSGISSGIPVFCNSVGPVEAGPLTAFQLLDGISDLLIDFFPEQLNYELTVNPSLSALQIAYNAVANSTVSIYYNNVLITGDQISLNGQGGTIEVLVQTSGIADRRYSFKISQALTDDCFIATAAFGSKYAPAVKLLRSFRDEYLLTNYCGKIFVTFYYRHSPLIANYIAEREGLRVLTRILLSPFIAAIYLIFHKWLLLLAIFICITIALSSPVLALTSETSIISFSKKKLWNF
jgi:hypothetical protein